MNEINFLISVAWAEGGRDVGDLMLKIEKCCEGVRASPTSDIPFDIPCILTQSVVRINPIFFSFFYPFRPNQFFTILNQPVGVCPWILARVRYS